MTTKAEKCPLCGDDIGADAKSVQVSSVVRAVCGRHSEPEIEGWVRMLAWHYAHM